MYLDDGIDDAYLWDQEEDHKLVINLKGTMFESLPVTEKQANDIALEVESKVDSYMIVKAK